MDEDLRSALAGWGIAQDWVDKLEAEEVHSLDDLLMLPDSDMEKIITKAGPRARLRARVKESIEAKQSSSVKEVQAIASSTQQLVNATTGDEHIDETEKNTTDRTPDTNVNAPDASQNVNENQSTQTAPGTDKTLTRKRPSQPSAEETPLKILCLSCLNGKLVLNYYQENSELNEDIRNLLADVILNDYLKDDYSRKIPVDVEKSMTDSILKQFPTEKREIWMSSDQRSRESAVGRGKILVRYYGKRRIMKKAGLLKKKEDGNAINTLADLADIDDDVDPDEYSEKVLWLTNNKTFSSRLTDYWKFTSKGRLRKLMANHTAVAEYMETYPALVETTGYLLLETDFETLHEGSSMNLYADWLTLSAFIESKVPKVIKQGITDTLTSEGKKIKTVQALPYLFNVINAAKKGRHKQWRPSREESAESILLHVLDHAAIISTLANRLKEKYEPFHLSLAPQAIVVGETVDSITKCYVRVNSILYEVDNALKAVDIAFKVMHALDCKYPKESEREWFFLETSIYRINLDKKNPLKTKTSSVVSDYERFKP